MWPSQETIYGMEKKETEKITNYSELRTEVGRMWRVRAKVIPIIVGALGTVPTPVLPQPTEHQI